MRKSPDEEFIGEDNSGVEEELVSDTYSPVITKPEDSELVEKLERKLQEYKNRLADPHYALLAPTDPHVVHLAIRIRILDEVLKEGEVNTWRLSRELINTAGYNSWNFEYAAKIIYLYTTGGTRSITGGTGLK